MNMQAVAQEFLSSEGGGGGVGTKAGTMKMQAGFDKMHWRMVNRILDAQPKQ